jgi:hypothetical protein
MNSPDGNTEIAPLPGPKTMSLKEVSKWGRMSRQFSFGRYRPFVKKNRRGA